MFVPQQYREPDASWLIDLITRGPLALLTTNGPAERGPLATHLPVILDPHQSGERTDDLSGTLLLGHMNVQNPHWAALRDGDSALLVFTGPHAYVSPTIYQTTPAAPTWNFTSVHVHGVLEKIVSREETLEVVKATVREFESQFGAEWDMTESVDYFARILQGVGAFRVTVSRAEGMFKLSQEQKGGIRDRVQQNFADQPCSRHREIADLMSRLPCAGGTDDAALSHLP
ncbi:FMN-binding negative transcriptional regulator [Streptomyces sp. PSAA01]|uniref:FMN-binding negative transcriptional regulator n=1 Tax=Streptomyces sp. PSAA01 TaxID=2912762 RepID=UPI001F29871E|nr:FMN-binding negative transcriptional regulator [Streptomyces sp. PSAA01]MCG0283772.1 FMN-binding negative transcriptional regulator [Streptomyces sp. PSAA01]